MKILYTGLPDPARRLGWRNWVLCAAWAASSVLLGSCREPLQQPDSEDPIIIEVVGADLWDREINAAVAAMSRQLKAAGGVAGRPVEFNITVIGSPAELADALDALDERLAVNPPFGIVGPIDQAVIAGGLLPTVQGTDFPVVFPFPRNDAVFELFPMVTNAFALTPPLPPHDAFAEVTSCTRVAVTTVPPSVDKYTELLVPAFDPVPVEVFSTPSVSQSFVDEVKAYEPDCVFMAVLASDTRKFMDLWDISGHGSVQWMGAHNLYVAAPMIANQSQVEGAIVTTEFYTVRSLEPTADFMDYLETIDSSLSISSQDVVAGIYDSIALLVLAAEYVNSSPETTRVSAVQIVSSLGMGGSDEVVPADMAKALRQARALSINYQGALGDLDIDPVTRYPDRRLPLLRYSSAEAGFTLVRFL